MSLVGSRLCMLVIREICAPRKILSVPEIVWVCVTVIHLRICDLIVAVVAVVVVVADAVPLLITVIAAVVDGTVCSPVESAGFGTIVGRRSTTSFRH